MRVHFHCHLDNLFLQLLLAFSVGFLHPDSARLRKDSSASIVCAELSVSCFQVAQPSSFGFDEAAEFMSDVLR